jgi:ABC-2 type transport system permease protein
MWSRILAILRKEFIQIRRDQRTLMVVLLMPAMQLVLFGYAINTVVDHLPTMVDDESNDSASRAFVAAFQNSGYFDLKGQVYSRTDAEAAINKGDAKVVLIIPPNFGDHVLAGEATEAQMLVDGADPNVAQTALFAGGMIGQVQSGNAVADFMSHLGAGSSSRGGIDLRPVVLFNPSMLSVNFMVPGLVGMILQFGSVMLTATAIVRERERGTLEQILVSPIRPVELMVGKVLPYVLTSFLSVAIALILSYVLFGVGIAGSLPLLVVLMFFFLLGSLGIGLLISTIARTLTQATQFSGLIMMPSILLAGFLFPREGMPPIAQFIGYFIPLTYFLQILRGIILKGVGLDVLWPNVLPLVIFSVAVFALSANRFQKRMT